jgi:hypothetical protein
MLRSKTVECNDESYVIKEIAVGKILPILPRLQGTPEEQQEAQIDIMKQCIFQNDVPLGDALLDIGLSAYMKLAMEVMEVNGLSAGEEGKDLAHMS